MIDYEAALDAFVVAQAQTTYGVYHPKTGQLIMEAMIRAVVAAALGDESLYRSNVPETVDPYVHSDTSLIQHLVDGGSLVWVWPEVTDGEG